MWAPNCPEWTIVQYATAKIGAILVNINPAYRTHELAYVLEQSGVRTAGLRDDVQDVGLRRDGRRGPAGRTGPVRGGVPRHRRLDDASSTGAQTVPTTTCAPGWPPSTTTEPINIQYTSGTTGSPKGATLSHRNILNNGYFTTELINLGPERPAVHPGAVLSLLRHGDGQPRLHQPRCHDGHSRSRVSTRATLRRHRKGSGAQLFTVCRRCSSRCSATRPRRPRPVVAAYRHHGRARSARSR